MPTVDCPPHLLNYPVEKADFSETQQVVPQAL